MEKKPDLGWSGPFRCESSEEWQPDLYRCRPVLEGNRLKEMRCPKGFLVSPGVRICFCLLHQTWVVGLNPEIAGDVLRVPIDRKNARSHGKWDALGGAPLYFLARIGVGSDYTVGESDFHYLIVKWSATGCFHQSRENMNNIVAIVEESKIDPSYIISGLFSVEEDPFRFGKGSSSSPAFLWRRVSICCARGSVGEDLLKAGRREKMCFPIFDGVFWNSWNVY